MFLAALILILSTALFFFYFQATCQKILRREFEQAYFPSIVRANRLEFPLITKELEGFDASVDYGRVRRELECDFLTLTHLMKHAANANQRYSIEERLLMLYFRAISFSLFFRHLLRLRERSTVLKLTAILHYLANVVGQRVNLVPSTA